MQKGVSCVGKVGELKEKPVRLEFTEEKELARPAHARFSRQIFRGGRGWGWSGAGVYEQWAALKCL